MNRCTYLLPIRRRVFDVTEANALGDYFRSLADGGCELVVIDGSPDHVFEEHNRVWSNVCRHERVERHWGYLNDKVNGIHTGVALAANEKIILADDDIRYSAKNLSDVVDLLDRFEVVRPQNFLRPLRWWSRMEAARMLINRATLRTADYPGTNGFRRSSMLRVGHYDGDVLFDNEEMIRHFASSGASICYANDLFIAKRPPTLSKWLEQRPRQAYEDFPLRAKTAIFFGIPPLLLAATLLGHALLVFMPLLLIPVLMAAVGRLRGKAARFFTISTCFFAPLWVIERSISTYCALYWYFARGGYPFGGRVLSKGVGRDWFAGRRAASDAVRSAK